jgi:predicted TPR repeat methyltransferase
MLERTPELAALAILEAALTASEAALLASYAELYNGALEGIPRGASVLRANTVIIHARRLAAALATYRDSLDRDALREQRALHRIAF